MPRPPPGRSSVAARDGRCHNGEPRRECGVCVTAFNGGSLMTALAKRSAAARRHGQSGGVRLMGRRRQSGRGEIKGRNKATRAIRTGRRAPIRAGSKLRQTLRKAGRDPHCLG